MKATCMNQLELAVRWGISHRTLERWRWTGEGPKFLKVGGRVVYRLSDVEEYERSITSSASSPYFLGSRLDHIQNATMAARAAAERKLAASLS